MGVEHVNNLNGLVQQVNLKRRGEIFLDLVTRQNWGLFSLE